MLARVTSLVKPRDLDLWVTVVLLVGAVMAAMDGRWMDAAVNGLLGAGLFCLFKHEDRTMFTSGTVTPPADLGPAIAALSPEARARMYSLLNGREPAPQDIAQAADWDNYERKSQ